MQTKSFQKCYSVPIKASTQPFLYAGLGFYPLSYTDIPQPAVVGSPTSFQRISGPSTHMTRSPSSRMPRPDWTSALPLKAGAALGHLTGSVSGSVLRDKAVRAVSSHVLSNIWTFDSFVDVSPVGLNHHSLKRHVHICFLQTFLFPLLSNTRICPRLLDIDVSMCR